MVSPRPASCLLQPMMLVFQLLPSTAAELEGAVETQSLVGINRLMQFVEAEPVTLGMEEVNGNLSCATFPVWQAVM